MGDQKCIGLKEHWNNNILHWEPLIIILVVLCWLAYHISHPFSKFLRQLSKWRCIWNFSMFSKAVNIFWNCAENCTVLKIAGLYNWLDNFQTFTLQKSANNKDSFCLRFISSLKIERNKGIEWHLTTMQAKKQLCGSILIGYFLLRFHSIEF